jgi:hypothetical protein
MDNQSSLEIAQEYLQKNYPHMADGHFSVTEHNPQHDVHLADHLDDVNASHFDDSNYTVVTSQKQIDVGNDVMIPAILKVKVQNGEVKGVLGSKSFDVRQISS